MTTLPRYFISLFFFLAVFPLSHAASFKFEQVHKGKAEQAISLIGNRLECEGVSKELSVTIAEKYHAEIERELPPTLKGDANCSPDEVWRVQLDSARREFCQNEKAISFLKRMHTRVKVIIR